MQTLIIKEGQEETTLLRGVPHNIFLNSKYRGGDSSTKEVGKKPQEKKIEKK